MYEKSLAPDLMPTVAHMVTHHAPAGAMGFHAGAWDDLPDHEMLVMGLRTLAGSFREDQVTKEAVNDLTNKTTVTADNNEGIFNVAQMAAGAFGSMMYAAGVSQALGRCIFCDEPVGLEHSQNPAAKVLYAGLEEMMRNGDFD